MTKGRVYGVGVGPGDPDLMTLKAVKCLSRALVIAYPAPDDGDSLARAIAASHIPDGRIEIPIIVPMRVARFPAQEVYDKAAKTIATHLDAGRDVVVLCEGDPLFYGSFMYLYDRLANEYDVEIIPGVSSLMACAAAWGQPLAARNDVLTIIPGPLPDEKIIARLETDGSAVIMKVGRHFTRIRSLIEKLGLTGRAGYVERATMHNQRVIPLGDVTEDAAPYFSMILIEKGAEPWQIR